MNGLTTVYGTRWQLAEAQKYMRPDRYQFKLIDGSTPGQGDIVLGRNSDTFGAGYLGITGDRETLGKNIWEYMLSVGANRGKDKGGLSNLYITGDIPEQHRVPGMDAEYTVYPGNRRYTPEQWLALKKGEDGAAEAIAATRNTGAGTTGVPELIPVRGGVVETDSAGNLFLNINDNRISEQLALALGGRVEEGVFYLPAGLAEFLMGSGE